MKLSTTKIIGLMCNKCDQFITERIPNTEVVPAFADRNCGIIYEWSSFHGSWIIVGDVKDIRNAVGNGASQS